MVAFLCIPASWESTVYDCQSTNRSVAGGMGALTGSPPCFLLVACESYMTPSRPAMHFLIAIRIRGMEGSGGVSFLRALRPLSSPGRTICDAR